MEISITFLFFSSQIFIFEIQSLNSNFIAQINIMNLLKLKSIYLVAFLLFSQCGIAQNNKGRIDFETYNPPSSLVVPGKA